MTSEEPKTMSPEEWQDEMLRAMRKLSEILSDMEGGTRSKPLFGGLFGASGAQLCSYNTIDSGLDEPVYFVRDAESKFLYGLARSKADAISMARKTIEKAGPARLQLAAKEFTEWRAKKKEDEKRQWQEALERKRQEWRDEGLTKVKSIPRRRKQIFDESDGKCHYCGTTLTLDGKWHIEHKMPKALGGGNEPGNLVASCVTCNHKKRDRTDIEFKAQRAKEQSA